MTDGYLSKDRDRLNRMQRERRAGIVRIDFMPDADVLALIDAKRAPFGPESTNSATLNAIVREWAEATGVNNRKVGRSAMAPKSGEARIGLAEIFEPTRASESGPVSGVSPRIAQARACARKSGPTLGPEQRVPCHGKRRRDGQLCQALSVPGKRRCKWHGGCSTGPKTAEGKARALANLRRGTPKTEA